MGQWSQPSMPAVQGVTSRASLKKQYLFALLLRRRCWNSTPVSFLRCSIFVYRAGVVESGGRASKERSHLYLA